MTTSIRATYEKGVLRPRRKLPFPEHTQVTLIVKAADPVSRTRARFHVPTRLARVLIYDDTLLEN